jgi:NTE family protein
MLPKGDAGRALAQHMSVSTDARCARLLHDAVSESFQPPGTLEATSFCDTTPLKATLERLVDFDLINSENYNTRLSLGSVNARSGQLVYFDTTTDVIRAEHVMASGALPPGFPAIEIDGEYYWDGGVVSNTPLAWIARQHPPSMLAFQVDLWAAPGPFPKNLQEVMIRMKEILNPSRTIYHTSGYKELNHLRSTLAHFLEQVPEEFKRGEDAKYLMSVARQQVTGSHGDTSPAAGGSITKCGNSDPLEFPPGEKPSGSFIVRFSTLRCGKKRLPAREENAEMVLKGHRPQ